MPSLALRAGGALLGVVLGLVASWAADALPRRYGIRPSASTRMRRRRNLFLVLGAAACGLGLGHVLSQTSGLTGIHAGSLLAFHLVVVAIVLAGAAIDLEHMILPDELTLGGALLCLVSSPARSVGLMGAIVGGLVGLAATYLPFLLYRKLRGHSGMGLGDAKLVVLAGAWFGPIGALLVLFGGAAMMPLAALTLRALGVSYAVPESVRAELDELRARAAEGDRAAASELADDPMASERGDGLLGARLPLGPFLALACVVVLFGRRVIEPLLVAWLAG
jgi:leader peptidase (prepilin peptidase)/N-methyltransferase